MALRKLMRLISPGCGKLSTVHCVHIVCILLYSSHCTHYCTVHTVHCTLHTVQCSTLVASWRCAHYTVHCTLYWCPAHCTVHTVPADLPAGTLPLYICAPVHLCTVPVPDLRHMYLTQGTSLQVPHSSTCSTLVPAGTWTICVFTRWLFYIKWQ